MIEIKITAGSYAEAAILMSALAASGMAIKGGAALVGAGANANAETLKVSASDKAAVVVAAKPQADAIKPAATKATKPDITYADVKAAGGKLASTPEGRKTMGELFVKYGVKVGTDLTAEQWPLILADINTASAS